MIRPTQNIKVKRGYAFERLMATIALVNLLLVAFDFSYIPWRDFYLKRLPTLTRWYGTNFKGIEPHRDTEAYLAAVDRLTAEVNQTGGQSPQVAQQLERLRLLSDEMINENPFQAANKSGTLERIKNRMRDQTGRSSSRAAFETFWSSDDLNRSGYSTQIAFFDQNIRPLMAANYYRNIGENGEFIDRFWRIDSWFIGLFLVEFVTRTLYLSRRYRGITWFDAVLWRWYDLFLLIPFWRWLRVVPVTIRLNQAHLVNLEPIRVRASQGIVTHFATELTETIVLRIVGDVQDLVRQGTITRRLLQSHQQYVDLNNVNEIEVIFTRLSTILVEQVLPKIRPDVEALVKHSLNRVLQQNPVYASLHQLPGFGNLSAQLTEQLVAEIYQTAYGSLTAGLNDREAAKLTQALLHKAGETFRTEVRREKTLKELEDLIVDLLEEIKVNYVDRISQQDVEQLRQQNHQLYGAIQGKARSE